MKRSVIASMVLASCAANAGTMGPVATSPSLMGFVSVEGGYTWNQVKGVDVTVNGFDDNNRQKLPTPWTFHLDSDQNNKGGTGRLAVGMMHPINDVLLLSGEIAWGYYGQTTSHFDISGNAIKNPPDISGVSLKNTLWGFDVLAGVVYNQPQYDLFFKAGALMQNSQLKLSSGSLDDIAPQVTGSASVKVNQTEALPLIRLGGSYHIWENLSIFAAYTHAFGSNEKISGNVNIPALNNRPVDVSANVNLQNPTMDVVTGGLMFRFA